MAKHNFRVIFTQSAWNDLEDIVTYWADRGEAERGVQYARDLPSEAVRQLADSATARSGQHLLRSAYPQVQELPVFKRSYRILYLVKESDGLVEVLRFWHSHRDQPFQS